MSQIDVNTSVNSVNVQNTINTVDVNQEYSNVLVIPEIITNIVEVVTPGPQGPPGDPSSLTGSFVSIGEFNAFTSSYNTGSFTGSFIGNGSGLFGIISASYSNTSSFALNFNPEATASFAISASTAQTSSFQSNIQYAQSHLAFFDSDNTLSSSAARQWLDNSIVINREFGTGLNPEALFVFQPNTESINITTFESNVDNYSQINVRNESDGEFASSDIVVTANNGDEFYYYVDMGINGSGYTPGYIGGPNDAYLYSLAENFHIGNASADGSHLGFFVGGDNVDTYNKLTLKPNDRHEMTGSLDVSEFIIIRNGLTVQNGATQQNVLTVSESIVRIIPQASDPVGTTDVGNIWFTSTAMYVGLD
jgi:hypothetical protein